MALKKELAAEGFVRHTITPTVNVEELRGDRHVKPSLLAELEKRSNPVPITPLVREYVGGLGRVHESVTGAIAEDIAKWDSIVLAAMERAKAELGEDNLGFMAVQVGEAGDETDAEQLFPQLLERW